MGTLEMGLIHGETNLDLNCCEKWVIMVIDVADQGPTLSITRTKLYEWVIT